MLEQTNLVRIKRYSKKFDGVMSDVYMVEINRNEPRKKMVIFENGEAVSVPKDVYKTFQNHIFVQLTERDISILEKVNRLKKHDLSGSTFALGVVTGDNKSKLLSKKEEGSEHIYTGKEVEKYRLLPPKNYLVFKRDNLQQVAPDEIYRAPEKLVYKTINKFLKVAIDDTKALTTNSANIIIPIVDGLDAYTIMALLNSNLYSYLHLKLFGGVNKIAKENLMALPLPEVSPIVRETIRNLITCAMQSGDDRKLQDYINKKIFRLNDSEIEYIGKFMPK